MLQKEDIVALVNEFHLVVDSFGDRSSEEQLKLLACSNESVKLLIDPLAAEVCVPVMPVCFTARMSFLPVGKYGNTSCLLSFNWIHTPISKIKVWS